MTAVDAAIPTPDHDGSLDLLDGWKFTTAVSLSFVAVAIVGVAVPGIISVLVHSLNLSADAAGWLGSASLWGLAAGAIIALPLSGRLPFKLSILTLMGVCAVVEFACAFVQSYGVLLILQVIVGAAAGMSASITGALFARARRVELLAGITSAVQAAAASLAFLILPVVVSAAGMPGAWTLLAGCVAAAFVGVLFIFPKIPHRFSDGEVEVTRTGEASKPWGVPAVLSIVSIFVFFIGTNAVYSFRLLQGIQDSGITFEEANFASSITVLFSIAGALLAGWIGIRWGRVIPVAVVGLMLTVSVLMLLGHSAAWVFWVSTALYQFSVTYLVIPWQEFQASLDARGRPVIVATFTGYVGIALGGSLGAILVAQNSGRHGEIDYLPLTVTGAIGIVVGVGLFLVGIVVWKGMPRRRGQALAKSASDVQAAVVTTSGAGE